MLQDFIEDLIKTIDENVATQITSLIAADGASRHELIRGRIIGLHAARSSVADLAKSYSAKEAA